MTQNKNTLWSFLPKAVLTLTLVYAGGLWAASASFHSNTADSDGVISSSAKSAVVNQTKADSTGSYPSLMLVAGGSGPVELFTGSLSSGAKSGASVSFTGALDSTSNSTGASSSAFTPMMSSYVSCSDDSVNPGEIDVEWAPGPPMQSCDDWATMSGNLLGINCEASYLVLGGTNYTSSPPTISASDAGWTDEDGTDIDGLTGHFYSDSTTAADTGNELDGTGFCFAMAVVSNSYLPYAYDYYASSDGSDLVNWRDNGWDTGTPVGCCWKDSGGTWHHSNNVSLSARAATPSQKASKRK